MNRDTLSRNAVHAFTPCGIRDRCSVEAGRPRLASDSEAKTSFTSRYHLVRKSYTTAKRCHSPGTPLSS
jgi:hypothetical protein